MPDQPNGTPKRKWVRAQVMVNVWENAKYIRDRFNLPNLAMAYTYMLHYTCRHNDPEKLCQDMAASVGKQLPPLMGQLDFTEGTPQDE